MEGERALLEVVVPDDVPTLAEAYEKVLVSETIRLSRGVHQVPETLAITKDVTIIRDEKSPESVILQGGEKNVLHLKSGVAEIVGVTVKNEGKEGDFSADYDAVQFSAPLGALRDCVFTSRYSGGFTVGTKDSNPAVTRCTAQDCGSCGFLIGSGATGTFRDCTASGNAVVGMGVANAGSNPTREECTFEKIRGTACTFSIPRPERSEGINFRRMA